MRKPISGGDSQRQSYWADVVRRWREAGQSVRAFCRAEGLAESAFYFWRRELEHRSDAVSRQSASAASGPSFLPVRLVRDDRAADQAIEIRLKHGRVVHVRAGFDRQALADVLAVLEAQPC